MPDHSEIRTDPRFALRLSAFYAAYFIGVGIQLPFFPLWLDAKGLDPRMIGIVLAVPMVMRIVAVPITTRRADRTGALRGAIIAGTVATAVGFVVLGLVEGAAAILAVSIVAALFATPVMPLADAYALRGLHGRRYGPVRMWGSLAFIVGNFAGGALIGLIAPRDLVWLLVASYAVTAIFAVTLAPLDTGVTATSGPPPPARRLLQNRAFLCVLVAASLIQASHAVYYGFSTIAWREAGFDGASVAALWSLAVLAEVVLFAVSARLPSAFSPTVLLMIGAAGAVIRWTAMAAGPSETLLPVLQLLHALSYGATHLGALGFLARTVPLGLGATAQGYHVVLLGIVMGATMGLSGALYEAFGAAAYLAMTVFAVAGGVFAIAAHRTQTTRC